MTNKLGEAIKLYRKAAKLTQKQLAEKLDKAESTVRMWELGKNIPSLETLKEISDALSIPPNELLFVELKSKVTQYVKEITKSEIKTTNSEKYKELYEASFEKKTIEMLLKKYNFNGLTDVGIKRYIKEILDEYLDKVMYEKKYMPHSNKSAIYLTYDRLNELLKEHVDGYFRDDDTPIKHSHYLDEDEIKENLSYELYSEISKIINKASDDIRNLEKSYSEGK